MRANDQVRGLTQQRLREFLHYDPETGEFTWAIDRSIRVRRGDPAGRVDTDGYRRIRVDGRDYFAQRLAWLWVHGVWPANFIDHRDGNRANNRIGNLRDVSLSCNMQNLRAAHADSTSGLLGTGWIATRKKWIAQIRVNGRSKRLGEFKTAEEAHAVYLKAKRTLHEGGTI